MGEGAAGAARVVSFLTDYGLDDPYVGEVKARMLSVCGEIRVIDVTHSVERQNVLHGAFLLYLSYRFFPEGTVHLAVVDPGVGTERRCIAIRTRRYWFVGPDNGLLYPAASEDGILRCYEIDLDAYPRYGGETFHGRDVFGPVAAELACGASPKMREVDPETVQKLDFGRPVVTDRGVRVRVLHVDRFGNCITNLRADELPSWMRYGDTFSVRSAGKEVRARFARAYGEVQPGKFLLTVGGTGFLEVSVSMGDAARQLGVRPGSELVVEQNEVGSVDRG
ncbi:MAG: S-adenosyl-l-methionine hydroxide adenosyltransferase family protein [Aigarchaeota archaeon]|nr:S-adenosyl-l-methionine hydroxide adenosyltransferase family protein [Candidatus Calditenuis fumarioli]